MIIIILSLGITYNQSPHELLAFKILSNNLTTAVLTSSIFRSSAPSNNYILLAINTINNEE